MFAAFGDGTLGLKMSFERQEELLLDSRFFPTPYSAHQGWVSVNLEGKVNWNEVAGLLLEAYKQVALKRMLKELELSESE